MLPAGRAGPAARASGREANSRMEVDMTDELFDATMILHHETERAILVSDDGDEERAVWLPKSQVEYEVTRGNVVEVTMPSWLAVSKGIV